MRITHALITLLIGIGTFSNCLLAGFSWNGYIVKTPSSGIVAYGSSINMEIVDFFSIVDLPDNEYPVSDGTPGSVSRDPTHVCIISRDVASAGGVFVFAHTSDKRDEPRTLGDRVSLWVKLSDSYYDEYDSIAFVDQQDMTTASAYLNADVVSKYETPLVVRTEVKNIQTRLNYLGFNAGVVDGKYGNTTRLAVEAFQRAFRRYALAVDGNRPCLADDRHQAVPAYGLDGGRDASAWCHHA